jgi:hypothetical protein
MARRRIPGAIRLMQQRGSVTDLLFIPEQTLMRAHWHSEIMEDLDKRSGPLTSRVEHYAALVGDLFNHTKILESGPFRVLDNCNPAAIIVGESQVID